MKKTKAVILFLLGDWVFTAIAWGLFSLFRYSTVTAFREFFDSITDFFLFPRTLKVFLLVPFIWLVIYYFSGFYNKPFRKTQVDILLHTLLSTAIGSLIIFFLIFLNDHADRNLTQYRLILSLFLITSFCVISIRLLLTSYLNRLISSGKINFKALFVGTGKNDLHFYNQMKESISGYDIIGYVNHSERRIKNEIGRAHV